MPRSSPVRPRFHRTSVFRVAISFAVLFVVALALLLGAVYRETMRHGLSEQDEALEAAAESIAGGQPPPDVATVVRRVATHIAAADAFSPELLVEDPAGRAIAGNLPTLRIVAGPFERIAPGRDRHGSRRLRLFGVDIAGGYRLAVGQDVRVALDVRELVDRLAGEFMLGGLLSLALMVGGGAVILTRLARRVDAIASATNEIMSGAIDRRLPISRRADEFDALSGAVNLMLDRLQAHVETVRQVSNDIAHDLRTPLTRLRRRLEVLTISADRPEEMRDLARRALAETDAILATFGALLRIGQIEAMHDRSHMKALDLSALLTLMTEVYTPMFEDAGQALEHDIASDLRACGDRDLIAQMVGNLLENASRHGAPHGRTLMTARLPSNYMTEIVVADEGTGIPADERERVLKRFYRLDRSRSTSGSGLGLSLAKAVVLYHRGELTLEDNNPGLRVTIRLQREAWTKTLD